MLRPTSSKGLVSLVDPRVLPVPRATLGSRYPRWMSSASASNVSAQRITKIVWHTARPAATGLASRTLPLSRTRQSISSSSKRYSSTSTEASQIDGQKLTRPCPSCGTSVPLPTSPCPSCASLLPLRPDLSLHSLLDLSFPIAKTSDSTGNGNGELDIPAELATLPSLGFDLQPRSLRNTMLFRQRDLHPDKYGSSGVQVVEMAKELSGRVNGAYAVLSDPLRRAEYIRLSVHGLPTEESDSLTDPDLLMEVLEAREELEEAASAEQVDALREANHAKVESTITSLKEALSASPPDLTLAKSLTIQLRYWTGLEAAAKEWAPGKGAGLSAGSGFTHDS